MRSPWLRLNEVGSHRFQSEAICRRPPGIHAFPWQITRRFKDLAIAIDIAVQINPNGICQRDWLMLTDQLRLQVAQGIAAELGDISEAREGIADQHRW